MCQRLTKEETARSEARKAAVAPSAEGRYEGRRQPWTYPEPRGNGVSDRREVERGAEKLTTVLGH